MTHSIQIEALQLPMSDRAALAEQLLASLENLPEAEVEKLWFAEAVRRAEEIDKGLVSLIAADQVRREAQALCR